jgi:hypothetical protein
LVKDIEAKEKLIPTAIGLLDNELLRAELSTEITKLGKPKATESIVDEIEKIAK